MKKMLLSMLALGVFAISADCCKKCEPCKKCGDKKVCKCKKEEPKKCCVKMVEQKVQPEKVCKEVCPAGSVEKK
jgi:hypothetical protein